MLKKSFQIAIDGPVAAGKGVVSRLLAEKLDFLYVDTGAMYRATALLAIENNLDFSQEEKIIDLLKKSKLEMRNPDGKMEKDGRLTTVILNGKDISWVIRTEKCSVGSSKVSVYPKIREVLVEKQQEIAKNQNVVMEGRDITFKVLPKADLKIYLTADLETRAKRRHQQYLLKGIERELEETIEEVKERDFRDMNRENDPLHIHDEAEVVDTSSLDIEEVVDLLADKAKKLMT